MLHRCRFSPVQHCCDRTTSTCCSHRTECLVPLEENVELTHNTGWYPNQVKHDAGARLPGPMGKVFHSALPLVPVRRHWALPPSQVLVIQGSTWPSRSFDGPSLLSNQCTWSNQCLPPPLWLATLSNPGLDQCAERLTTAEQSSRAQS